MAKIYRDGSWASDRLFPRGMSEDERDRFVENEREALSGRGSGYQKPPKTIHQHKTFGGRMPAVEQTPESILQTLREAAERGDKQRQYLLGEALEFGKFGEKNPQEALIWYRKSGWPEADAAIERILHPKPKSKVVEPKSLSCLPRIEYAHVDVGRVVDGKPRYIVLVKNPKARGFRPAAAIAWEKGVVLEDQEFDSAEAAGTAADEIKKTWGRK